MEFNYLYFLKYAYVFVLVAGTIWLVIDCWRSYLKDEDVSQTEYKRFHYDDPENVYPSITFCIEHPLLAEKLQHIGDGINISIYKNFLRGRYWDDRLLEVNYDNVTTSLNDSLIGVKMMLHQKINLKYLYSHKGTKFPDEKWSLIFVPDFRVSLRLWNKKCFNFDIPYKDQQFMTAFEIYLRNRIFPSGVRPAKPSKNGGFLTYFHYPGQYITAGYTNKFEWNEKEKDSKPYTMEFRIQNVQVIKRRNKPSNHCSENMRHFDTQMMNHQIIAAGCRLPHINTTIQKPLCTNKKQMQILSKMPNLFQLEPFYLPCKSIYNLRYDYYENDIEFCK